MYIFRNGVMSALLATSVFLIPVASAQTASTKTNDSFQQLLAQLAARTFPLLPIANCDRQGTVYQFADLDITIKGSDLLLAGRDLSDHMWQANTSITGLGCKIFRADLDGNEKEDLIIYAPGITSRAPYDTNLTILLFDQQGRPTPWIATGRFDLSTNGIRQITRSVDRRALILRSYSIGLPMWGGVSYVATAYVAANDSINLQNGQRSGISFPLVMDSKGADAKVQQAVSQTNLSTDDVNQNAALKQNAYPLFLRYGAQTSTFQAVRPNTHLTVEQAANVRIDTDAVEAAKEHILLSDGSKLNIPSILIVDSADGARTIIFNPDSSDISKLTPNSYEIHSTGTECQDADDCRPFILRAVKPSS